MGSSPPKITLFAQNNTAKKNNFFRKKSEKIFSDENFQNFPFPKGGSIDLERLDLPRNTVMKNMFFSKKN